MGWIGKLFSFTFTSRNGAKIADVKFDPGGGATLQGEHFAPPGDDSQPLPGDYPYAAPTARTGGFAVVGYLDPKNDQKAQAGEKRIYARDNAGASVVELWLKADGSAVLSNASGSVTLGADGSVTAQNGAGSHTLGADGSFTAQNGSGALSLAAGGTIDLNGVTIDPSGNIIQPGAATLTAGAGLTVGGQQMKDHYHTQGVDSAGDTQQNTSGPTGP